MLAGANKLRCTSGPTSGPELFLRDDSHCSVNYVVLLKGHLEDFPGDPVVRKLPAGAWDMVLYLAQEDSTSCGATKPEYHN